MRPSHRTRLALPLMLCFGASCAQAPSGAGGEPDDFEEVVPPHTAVLDAGPGATTHTLVARTEIVPPRRVGGRASGRNDRRIAGPVV